MGQVNAHFKPCLRQGMWTAVAVLSFFIRSEAQANPPGGSNAAPVAQSTDGMAEIVVTATKRSEKLSKVPASIVALSQEQLNVKGVRQVQDLVALTPGISFSQNTGFSSGNSTVSVRGIVSKAGAPTTGVYIDDTPIQALADIENYLGSAFPKVFDLQRVEVLRGPQGTLFGGGAEGGVVRFITPKPSLSDYSVYARGEVSGTQGGDLSHETGIAVGGPIIEDKLGFRASIWQRDDGGYTDRRAYTTGQLFPNSDSSNSIVSRLAFTVQPIDNLTITPSINYQRLHQDDQSIYWPSLSNLSAGQFVRGSAVATPSTDFFYLSSLNIDYNLSDIKLSSVTSNYYRSGKTLNDETNGTDFNLVGVLFPTVPDHAYFDNNIAYTEQRAWTEEARVQSTDPNARFKWVGGIFYQLLHQGQGETANDPYLNEFLSPILGTNFLPNGETSDVIVKEGAVLNQVSAFGSADYTIVDNLTATVGLRVTKSTLDFYNYTNGVYNGGLTTAQGSIKETPVTPKFALSWQQTPDTLYYVSAAKGYRIGGVNVPAPVNYCGANLIAEGLSGTPATYQSDSLWSYELGTKNRLADGNFRYEASVYHIDWSNVQLLNLLPCGYAYTANAASAESNGFDLSLQGKLFNSVVLGLDIGYTDAHYSSTVKTPSGSILAQGGAELGDPVAGNNIPPWSVSVTAQYDIPFYEDYAPYIFGEYDFHSRSPGPFTSQNPSAAVYDPTIPADPSTNLVKLRTGVHYSGVELSIFVDNLLNSHPQIGLYHSFPTQNLYAATTFRPRTVGLNAVYRY